MTARDRTVLAVVAALALVVGGWLLVIQPKRSEASKLGGQVNSEQTQLTTAQAQVAAGEVAKRAYATSYSTLVRLGEAVPSDDNVPSLIYQLQGAATGAGVDFRALTVTGGSGGTTSSSSSGSAASALPPGATMGPAGFPIEPFTFTFNGNFFRLADFFGRLQRFVTANNQRVSVSGRLMTLNAITLGPGPLGFPQVAATVSATTFLVPASQGLLNGATPSGPTTSPAQGVSTGGSSSAPPAAVAIP